MIRSKEAHDFELAYKLEQQNHCFGLTENAVIPDDKDKENYKPRTLIDQTLELIDPTPNIFTLFVQFNERFFWNVLLPVEVKWSSRMTSCAGICSFHPRNRQCIISLSAPLLKLRPRKDVVETLLHEMIHGYLFLTNNNRDRDGHGPEFCKHMNRINKAAGTKITIYHSFHDEVKLYQQHWWRCNGPCQKKAPYFGMVRRAMNRAPGPSDFWWNEHKQTCGGQFIKIKEPENYKAKSSKSKEKAKPSTKNNNIQSNNMIDWLVKSTSPISKVTPFKPPKNQNFLNGLVKLGNATNNVHGWGTGGPGISNSSQKNKSHRTMSFTKTIPPATIRTSVSDTKQTNSDTNSGNSVDGFKNSGNGVNNVHSLDTYSADNSCNSKKCGSPSTTSIRPKFSSSGILGGSKNGRSNLLSKFSSGTQSQELKGSVPSRNVATAITGSKIETVIAMKSNETLVECPICNNFIPADDINGHVDSCLTTKNDNKSKAKVGDNSANSQLKSNYASSQKRKSENASLPNKQRKLDEFQNSKNVSCPICSKAFNLSAINEHLDICLLELDKEDNKSTPKLNDANGKNESMNDSIISLSSTSSDSSSSPCAGHSKNLFPNDNVKNSNTVDSNTSHNCLVCNQFIPTGTSLTEHLEDCINNVFKDESTLSIDCDNTEILNVPSTTIIDDDDKYPCPVCMQLIMQTKMKEHLDICLLGT